MELGVSKEQLREMVVAKAAEQLVDELGGHEFGESALHQAETQIKDARREAINEAVERLADEVIKPMVNGTVEDIVIQETNAYGEKTGEARTFREYLVARAEIYMTEQVDYSGELKAECRNGYNWSGKQSRITYMVHKHLQYSIETAMKAALQIANSSIATGIQETVKVQLEAIIKGIKTEVKMPR